MNLNDYITNNYEELKQTCLNITKGHDLTDDLFQLCIEYLLLTPENKMNKLLETNKVKFYFIKIIQNQFFSNKSEFYKLYRKDKYLEFNPNLFQTPDDEYDEEVDNKQPKKQKKIKHILNELEKLHWYKLKVVEMRQQYTYKQMNEITKIPITALCKTYSKIKLNIKNSYND